MSSSEKLAIAAHLHVLLRRKTGRVTDTEWLASNAEYANEIVRFARVRAQEDGHADLAEWADKLAATMPASAAAPARTPSPLGFFRAGAAPQPTQVPNASTAAAAPTAESAVGMLRYVNGIR